MELVTEVIQETLPRALDRHIDLGYDGVATDNAGVWVSGNRTLLKESFRNLIDNALNYTTSSADHPGVVTVRLLADRFGHVVVFQVEDNGPGVPEAERDLVFQPFYRALGTEADGSGLGLPIVLEIAQQHGGLRVYHPRLLQLQHLGINSGKPIQRRLPLLTRTVTAGTNGFQSGKHGATEAV